MRTLRLRHRPFRRVSPLYAPPQNPVTAVVQAGYPLGTSPDPVALGVISAGRPADAELVLRNHRSVPLTLERTVTSCPCIAVGGVPVRLKPNEAKSLRVAFDPTEDPEFRGALSVDISGYDESGGALFRARAELEVR